jgi:flavin-dependent dehydrogenase
LGISRRLLDQLAIEHCRELGVEVMEGTQVREVMRDGERVNGVRASCSGERLVLNGQVIIGADGHHSAVSRELGLDRPSAWPQRIGLAAHYENFPLTGELGEMHVGRHGYCGIAPQEGGRINAAMVVELERVEARAGTVAAFFERELVSYPGLCERAAGARRVTAVRGVGPLARRVRRVSGDGFLLVGDAAGFFDPFTGEGIVDALRGGELAAEVVSAALCRGDTSARGLAGYAEARQRVFQRKRRAAWLVQAFVRSPGLMDYAVRRIATRSDSAAALTGVFGDYRDAGIVLSPRFLWRTLRP